MTYALGTSRGDITAAPLLLIDLETEEGVTGRAYLFCYLPGGGAGDRARSSARCERVVKGERRRAGRSVAPSSRGASR